MKVNLDDINKIKKIDKNDMASILEAFAFQSRAALSIAERAKLPASYLKKKYKNIIFCGMGGSAIGADLLKDILRDKIKLPVYVCRQYNLPAFASKDSLIFISSYSGNTEETISCLRQALKKKNKIITISSGGKVESLAKKHKLPHIKIHSGYPPRFALGFSFFCILKTLVRMKLVDGLNKDISETLDLLEDLSYLMVPAVKKSDNEPKRIAQMIYNKFIVIYSSSNLSEAVSVRFKGQLAENSKTLSSVNFIPEMNHNEIEGWKYPKEILAKTAVIFLEDLDEALEIRCRFKATKKVIKSSRCKIITLIAAGKSKMAKIFSLVHFCDWLSYYLAILNATNPYPVERIEKLKKQLKGS
jgi:glucose/mannose-6-phosphate isomerase